MITIFPLAKRLLKKESGNTVPERITGQKSLKMTTLCHDEFGPSFSSVEKAPNYCPLLLLNNFHG